MTTGSQDFRVGDDSGNMFGFETDARFSSSGFIVNAYTGQRLSVAGKSRSFDVFDGSDGYDILAGTTANEVFIQNTLGSSVEPGGGRVFHFIRVEEIDAGSGSDVIDLTLPGGAPDSFGAVRVLGGAGSDVLWGGGNDEVLYGDQGDGSLFGGSDSIHGGGGADAIFGEGGADVIDGGTGDDRLDGGSGSDIIHGGSGHDLLLGKNGNDTMDGGVGEDELIGGEGADNIRGGEGDDIIDGGQNDGTKDILVGDAGSDVFRFEGLWGSDVVIDFDPNEDLIDLSYVGQQSFSEIEADATQVGSDLALNIGNEQQIILRNIIISELSDVDFIFSN